MKNVIEGPTIEELTKQTGMVEGDEVKELTIEIEGGQKIKFHPSDGTREEGFRIYGSENDLEGLLSCDDNVPITVSGPIVGEEEIVKNVPPPPISPLKI